MLEFQEIKIKKLIYEMHAIYADIINKKETEDHLSEENQDSGILSYEILELENEFENLAHKIYIICLAYFEKQGLPLYRKKFDDEISLQLQTPAMILQTATYNEGEDYREQSALLGKLWNFLAPFSFFDDYYSGLILKKTGLTYLEKILESTAIIIKDLDKQPKNETEVYNVVKTVCKATFSDAQFPTQSFQKTAKCYSPDILVPSLNCAIEYKYSKDEQALIRTIDEILIDVKGYEKHPNYKVFYAVFYTTTAIWPKSRFDEVWKEKEFPTNWKGILVNGG